MTEMIRKMVIEQNKQCVKETFLKETQENNIRLQHCLVETLYESQRYSNLGISGLKFGKDESPKTAVAKYAESNGVTLASDQIQEVRELKGKESDKWHPVPVRFDSESSREKLIEAKFAAINKRKTLEREIEDLFRSDNPVDNAKAEAMKTKQLEPLKRVRISEDLTP